MAARLSVFVKSFVGPVAFRTCLAAGVALSFGKTVRNTLQNPF